MSAFLRVKLNIDTPTKPVEKTPEAPAAKQWLKKLYQRRKTVAHVAVVATVVLTLIALMALRPTPPSPATNHLVKLRCKRDSNRYHCDPAFIGGTFVVRTFNCAAIFDINGFPWHVVATESHRNIYEVPYRSELSVKDVDPGCRVDVFQDTSRTVAPKLQCLTWTTTAAVDTFTLVAGDDVVIDHVPSDMLEISRKGPWRAFFYDWDASEASFDFRHITEPIFTYGCAHG